MALNLVNVVRHNLQGMGNLKSAIEDPYYQTTNEYKEYQRKFYNKGRVSSGDLKEVLGDDYEEKLHSEGVVSEGAIDFNFLTDFWSALNHFVTNAYGVTEYHNKERKRKEKKKNYDKNRIRKFGCLMHNSRESYQLFLTSAHYTIEKKKTSFIQIGYEGLLDGIDRFVFYLQKSWWNNPDKGRVHLKLERYRTDSSLDDDTDVQIVGELKEDKVLRELSDLAEGFLEYADYSATND